MGISEFKGGLLNPKTFVNLPQYQEKDGQVSRLAGVLRVFFSSFFGGWVGRGVCYVSWCFHLAMTKNRLMVAFGSNKGPYLKVVKWC